MTRIPYRHTIWDMETKIETKTKTLNLPTWIVNDILDIAKKEKRSFTKQVETLLEDALRHNKEIEDIKSGKTQIDPSIIGAYEGE